jgi:formylglycine-generating enzyme required for sulfatase activity/uncharacterized protein YjbI with pentapeptide repeats
MNLYDVLQIRPDASAEVIRAAYKALAALNHPDRDRSPEAAARFGQVQLAYETLSDDVRRARYDAEQQSNGVKPAGQSDRVIMRVDGTSSHLTLGEHLKRGGRELSECDLSGLILDGISFRSAVLIKAKLDGSSLIGCDFRQADLTDCSAQKCKFDGVYFGGAKLVRTNFHGSSLRNAAFFSAGAIVVSLREEERFRFHDHNDETRRVQDRTTETGKTIVQRCDFSRCDLTESQFSAPGTINTTSFKVEPSFGGLRERQTPVYSQQQFFSCAPIESIFQTANLQKCNLSGIPLIGNRFEGAVLNGANLRSSCIDGVDLSSSSVIDILLHKAEYSRSTTRLPDGFRMPSDANDLDPARREQEEKAERLKRTQKEEAEKLKREKEEEERKVKEQIALQKETELRLEATSLLRKSAEAAELRSTLYAFFAFVGFIAIVAAVGLLLKRGSPTENRPILLTNDRQMETIVNSIGMTLVRIPTAEHSGRVDGSAELPQKRSGPLQILKPFFIGKTEVTQKEWYSLMRNKPWENRSGIQEGDDFPAVYVSWDDAVLYCRKLSNAEGKVYRLPTESEWRYSFLCGSPAMGDVHNDTIALTDTAWFVENAWKVGEGFPHVVGQKLPNQFGLYDMLGNVSEWCVREANIDDGKANVGVPNAGMGSNRGCHLGGGWSSSAEVCHPRHSISSDPSAIAGDIGFRIVLEHVEK